MNEEGNDVFRRRVANYVRRIKYSNKRILMGYALRGLLTISTICGCSYIAINRINNKKDSVYVQQIVNDEQDTDMISAQTDLEEIDFELSVPKSTPDAKPTPTVVIVPTVVPTPSEKTVIDDPYVDDSYVESRNKSDQIIYNEPVLCYYVNWDNQIVRGNLADDVEEYHANNPSYVMDKSVIYWLESMGMDDLDELEDVLGIKFNEGESFRTLDEITAMSLKTGNCGVEITYGPYIHKYGSNGFRYLNIENKSGIPLEGIIKDEGCGSESDEISEIVIPPGYEGAVVNVKLPDWYTQVDQKNVDQDMPFKAGDDLVQALAYINYTEPGSWDEFIDDYQIEGISEFVYGDVPINCLEEGQARIRVVDDGSYIEINAWEDGFFHVKNYGPYEAMYQRYVKYCMYDYYSFEPDADCDVTGVKIPVLPFFDGN